MTKKTTLIVFLVLLVGIISADNETTTEIPSLQTEDDVLPVSTTEMSVISEANKNSSIKIQTSQTRNYHNVQVQSPVLNVSATSAGPPKMPSGGDFRPSPQLETYYEFNGFPSVQPALPEPKLFGANIKIPILSTATEQPTQTSLADNNKNEWNPKVRFPETHPLTVSDHPYPYMRDGEKMMIAKRPIMDKHYSYSGPDYWGADYGKPRQKPSKTYYEEEHHSPHPYELSVSPWKKLIKVLTAFIPIGLLISALTPSIITIGPANATSRGRMDEKQKGILGKLSLQGCDDRIFCELLLSAEENGQSSTSIENMVDHYLQKYGDATKLKQIYKAIKSGNCSSLHCDTIKKP